ncbi:MAG: hypothetical protein H6744_21980 [Deltaproteobacteria bacterium]|nr:hypothetical protein [Deltaproteobacteria bacterium]
MSWQDDWRMQAWQWARRLDALATGWLQIERQGMVASAAVRGKRELALKVRGWIYEVIETFLGGVDKLPNTVPIGALPHLVIGGAIVVTVASIGAWVANEEERLIDAKRLFVKAVGQEVAKASDPVVQRKLAGVAEQVQPKTDKAGFPWGWLLLGLALTGGAGMARQRWRDR